MNKQGQAVEANKGMCAWPADKNDCEESFTLKS
jgi:hypothetical protein